MSEEKLSFETDPGKCGHALDIFWMACIASLIPLAQMCVRRGPPYVL